MPTAPGHPGLRLGASLWRDDQPLRSAPDGESALARLVWLLNGAAVEHASDGLALHAAAVAQAGRVVLIAGESGAGKSTLTSGLVVSGFDYLGDEVSTVDPDHRVTGMPRAAKLSARSIEAIGLAGESAIWLGNDGHVPPERLRLGATRHTGRLAAVVLPHHRPHAPWAEELLSPINAATAPLPCVFGGRPFTQFSADVLGSIATTVPVHRIHLPDLATAVRFASGLVDGG